MQGTLLINEEYVIRLKLLRGEKLRIGENTLESFSYRCAMNSTRVNS